MDTLLQDLRYAFRTLARAPGFALVAVLTLGLGIGANTALFSLVDAAFLRPLPGVENGGELAWLTQTWPDGHPGRMSYLDLQQYRARVGAFSGIAGYASLPMALGGGAAPERVDGQVVTGDFFPVLGTRPALGRFFGPDEDTRPGEHPVAVISHALWTRRFAADPSVVGRRLVIAGHEFAVVGVAPRGFVGPELSERRVDVWVPASMSAWAAPGWEGMLTRPEQTVFSAVGRLRAGASPGVASVQARAVAAGLRAEGPADAHVSAAVTRMRGGAVLERAGEAISLVVIGQGITGIVLLIACANVASLLLGRAAARRREIAVRLALGAGRRRLVRQLLTEGAVLAVAGAAVGIWMALAGTRSLLAFLQVPLPLEPAADGWVLAGTALVALGATLAFALVPALHASRRDVQGSLKGEAPGPGEGRARGRLQGGFAAAQVALSLVLLTSAGLLLRSLGKAGDVDLGFATREQVVTLGFDPATQGYAEERAQTFGAELLRRARGVPGVDAAALATTVPLSGTLMRMPYSATGDGGTGAFTTFATPGYFATLGVPVVRGRDLAPGDVAGAPRVMVVNETMARRFWPGQDALGQTLRVQAGDAPITVVGIARDSRFEDLSAEVAPMLVMPLAQAEMRLPLHLLARARRPADAAAALRREAAALDAGMALEGPVTLSGIIHEQLAPRRAGGMLVTLFGALALLLSTVGAYAVVAGAVARRIPEVGVRMALGARGRDVLALFAGQGARMVGVGLAAGLVLSLGAARLLSGYLLGVGPADLPAFAGGAVLLTGATLLATWLPARRATRVDPMVALRGD
ncbi:MAG TPA: ABC transporter permease [Longimicrobiaceae bacterium]|nr:ABC transporter permease [Longimicrobiaceae bacterium]